jgi:hypothetical protein
MGYFSNGTEGALYYEQWCSRCIHDNEDKEIYCPVWGLHLTHNYAACNDDASPLHALIPREGMGNGRCTMFVDRGLLSNLAIQKFESDAALPATRDMEASNG